MMKIGVSIEPYGKAANCFGKELFQKISSFGFSSIDYNITDTRYELYSMDDAAFEQRLREEKEAAQAAGLVIHQMHGPWRSLPRDATVEDRQERMEALREADAILREEFDKNGLAEKVWQYFIAVPDIKSVGTIEWE